jgi:hypothetical protein
MPHRVDVGPSGKSRSWEEQLLSSPGIAFNDFWHKASERSKIQEMQNMVVRAERNFDDPGTTIIPLGPAEIRLRYQENQPSPSAEHPKRTKTMPALILRPGLRFCSIFELFGFF